MDSEGMSPALVESAEEQEVDSWLSNRIREIERFVGRMPSTAIFVNSEAEVVSMAIRLNKHLAEHNLHAMACHEGQAIGQEGDIRVFDIQHIKGLEFEAVFFVGVDRLASNHPDLFDKFLYVGTTRAASYLGVTCEAALPTALDSLRPLFVENWKQTPALVSRT
jgi:DNA helicase IV